MFSSIGSSSNFKIVSPVHHFVHNIVIIISLCTGMSNNEVMNAVRGGYHMPRPTDPVDCPEPLYDVMLNCWCKEKENRATFKFLEEHLSNWDRAENYAPPEINQI